ncbi:MAG: NAD-dependent DNA ligase LigA [Patescibacteria group bacterium]|nr:NAD-dependent DNA ligase LigA [Patescibacteria group bacterium]
MNIQEIKTRIEKLKKEIDHHRYLYHVLDKSEISEAALDSLKKELFDLEKKYPEFITQDSPSMRVSGIALDKFEKIFHSFPVLSLQDIFSIEEFYDWENRNKKIADGIYDYFCELKLDGLTIVLTYKNGVLQNAATRGDGKIGENVINNIKTIESVPLKLRDQKRKIPETLTVRGEVVLTKSYFEKINKQRERDGLDPFANPRNIAAGSIRQLDPSVTRQRELLYFAYYFDENLGQKTHEEEHQILQDFGFKISNHNEYCKNDKQVEEYLKKWEEKRKKLDYMTDGVVIIVNNLELEKKLGNVGKTERWMIAYKFPAEQVTSQVKDIIFQVGRTGAITPVAILEPRKLAGSLVSRATLHNFNEIKRLDVRIADTVILQKAGDVIPDIVEVLTRLRNGNEKKVLAPRKCPVCNSDVYRKESEVNYYCSNKNCYAVQKEGIIHFVSKKAFNMEGLGIKIVEQLIECGLIKDVSDIFKLKREDLLPLQRFADKSADNLIESIENSKKINFDRFIYSLGIRHVGDEISSILAYRFGNLEKFMKVSEKDLTSIKDIGPKVCESVYQFINNDKNINLINKLIELGVKIIPIKVKSQKLKGKILVLTGSLNNFTRDNAKKLIRGLGGKVSLSISSEVDYLVSGNDPGSKFDKAEKLGVKIINEQEFEKLIGD